MSSDSVKIVFNTPDFPLQVSLGSYARRMALKTPIAGVRYDEAGGQLDVLAAIPFSRKNPHPSFWDFELKLSGGGIFASKANLPFGYDMDGFLDGSATAGAALMTGPDFQKGKWGFTPKVGANLVFVNLAENEVFSTENIRPIPIPTLEGSIGLSYRFKPRASLGFNLTHGHIQWTPKDETEPRISATTNQVALSVKFIPQKKS